VIYVVAADSFLVGFIAWLVLLASGIAACGVIWKALRKLWRAVNELETRYQKLHDLSDPNGKDEG
jgi:hypothetical protein